MAEGDQPEVLLHGGVQEQALTLAVLRYEADPGLQRGVDVVPGQRPAGHDDGARVVRVGAEHGPYDLGAARADQTGQAHHLAGPHLEGDVLEVGAAGEALDAQQGGRVPFGVAALARVLRLDGAADHQPHQFVLGGVRRYLGDAAAVAQDSDAVAEGGDLLQMVGDEDDADAVLAERPDDPEELGHLFGGEHGGRLVHDQDAGVEGERLGDLDHLEPGDAQFAHPGARCYVHAHPVEQFGGGPLHRLAVDEAEAAGLAAEKDVLGDAQVRYEVELLVDGCDAVPLGVLRAVDAHGLAADEDAARVRTVGAGEHLDECRLARAVLAEQGVHLAGAQIEIDAVERDHAGEGLAHALHAEQFEGGRGWRGRGRWRWRWRWGRTVSRRVRTALGRVRAVPRRVRAVLQARTVRALRRF